MKFFRDLRILALALTACLTVAAAEPLPQIEMPEVVISGVERATVIRAERLPTSLSSPEFAAFPGFSNERPAIQAQSVEIIPSRPLPTDIPRFAFIGGRLGGGNLAALNGRLEAGVPFHALSLGLHTQFDKLPRRIDAGALHTSRWEFDATHDMPLQSRAFYKLGYSEDGFRLVDVLGDLQWKDFYGGVNMSPAISPVGVFAGNFGFDVWDANVPGQRGGSEWQGSLNHRVNLRLVELESRLSCQYEAWDTDIDQLGVIGFSSLADFQALESVEIRAGLAGYSGYTTRFGHQTGIDPRVETNWNLSRIERVSMEWMPGYEVFPTREIVHNYPMIVHNTGGSIAEDFARLQLTYLRRVGDTGQLTARLRYHDSPHYPLPSKEESIGWALETTRLRWFQTKLGFSRQLLQDWSASACLGFNSAKAWNPNLKQDAPQIEPWFAEATLLNDGQRLDAALRLKWRDGAAVGLLDDRTFPAHWESEVWAAYELGHSFSAFAQVSNLLNDSWWLIPGYDAPPFAALIGLGYGYAGNGRLLRKEF